MRAAFVATVATACLMAFSCSGGGGDSAEDAAEDAGTATTTTAMTVTTEQAATSRCESVPFTPASEDMASDVTATGLSCAEAEDFVRVAGTRTSAGGPKQLDVEGYRCVMTGSDQETLPRAFYECTKGGKKVTFVRS